MMLDEHYLLPTPESVPISYELAGIGSRFAAALLNALIVGGVDGGLLVIAGVATSLLEPQAQGAAATWAFAIAAVLAFALTLGYDLVFEIAWNGQSPGKRAMGIRVVRDDGTSISGLAAVLRNVLRLVDFLPAYYIIGVIVMLIDRKARRLGDLAAGTIVVKERRDLGVDQLSLSGAVFRPLDPSSFAQLDLSLLTTDDRRLVKEYLLRRRDLTPVAQAKLARRIAEIVAAKLSRPLGDDDPAAFLVGLGTLLEVAASLATSPRED